MSRNVSQGREAPNRKGPLEGKDRTMTSRHVVIGIVMFSLLALVTAGCGSKVNKDNFLSLQYAMRKQCL